MGVDDFKSKIRGGGARPNLFKATINFPAYAEADVELTSFLCESAQIPGSTLGQIVVPFRGRQLKMAGDRTFDVLTITVINDTDFLIRNAFERWMNAINKHDNATGEVTPADYQTDMYVNQIGRAPVSKGLGGSQTNQQKLPILRKYKFHGTFPTNVSAIELSYDQTDSIEEFTEDLQDQWWDVFDGEANPLLTNQTVDGTGAGASTSDQ